MQSFSLAGQNIDFADSAARFAALLQQGVAQSRRMCLTYREAYRSRQKIRPVLEHYQGDLFALLQPVIEEAYGMAKATGAELTREDFVNIYCAEYACYRDALEGLCARYEEMLAKESEAYAHDERLARQPLKWTGGCGNSVILGDDLNSIVGGIITEAFATPPPAQAPLYSHEIEKLYEYPDVREGLYRGVAATVLGVYLACADAVNSVKGEEYYKKNYDRQQALGLLAQFRQIPQNQKEGGRGLLAQAIGLNPLALDSYREYALAFGDAALELEAICDFFLPLQQFAQTKVMMIRQVLQQYPVQTEADYRRSEQQLGEYCFGWLKLDARRIQPYWDSFRTIGAAYSLAGAAKSGVLHRFNSMPPQPAVSPGFEQELSAINDALAAARPGGGGKAYHAECSEQARALLELYDQNYRTVQGILYPTRAEADDMRAKMEPVAAAFAQTNFEDEAAVQALNEKLADGPADGVFGLLRRKSARCVALSKSISQHMAEVANRNYGSRQEMVYFLTRGRLLSGEAQLLGLKRPDLDAWQNQMEANAVTVYGTRHADGAAADAAYYTTVHHALAYLDYLRKQNDPQGNVFSKLASDIKGALYVKNYEQEYRMVTGGGQYAIPVLLENEEKMATGHWQRFWAEWAQKQAAVREEFDPLAAKGQGRLQLCVGALNGLLAKPRLDKLLLDTAADNPPEDAAALQDARQTWASTAATLE